MRALCLIIGVAFVFNEVDDVLTEEIDALVGKHGVINLFGDVGLVNAVGIIVYEAYAVLGGYVVNVFKVIR